MADETVITITDRALEKILELRAGEPDADQLGLRIEVVGQSGVEYTYDLAFEELDAAEDDDHVEHHGELPVMIPADSVDKLRGATLDLPSNPNQGGMVLRNPNRPSAFGEDIELTGTTEEKVRTLIERQINPAIAGHGGYAELVKVEGDTVYLRLGGGCQGCAMSAVTLRAGIETVIKERVPEVVEIIDVTDHEAGENPFYAAV